MPLLASEAGPGQLQGSSSAQFKNCLFQALAMLRQALSARPSIRELIVGSRSSWVDPALWSLLCFMEQASRATSSQDIFDKHLSPT